MKSSIYFIGVVCAIASCTTITSAKNMEQWKVTAVSVNNSIPCVKSTSDLNANFTELTFNGGCKNPKNCTFILGKTYSGKLTFKPVKNYANLVLNITSPDNQKVHIGTGKIGKVVANTTNYVNFEFKFDKKFFANKTGKTLVQLSLKNATGPDVLCRLLPVDIKGASNIVTFSFFAVILQQIFLFFSK